MRTWSLSTRLLVAVLLAAGIPFIGFTFYVVSFVRSRISEANAERFLRSKAIDVADKVNTVIRERRRDLLLWSRENGVIDTLDKWYKANRNYESSEVDLAIHARADHATATAELTRVLDTHCQQKGVFEFLVVLDNRGQAIAHNTRDPRGEPLSVERVSRLNGWPFFKERWFALAMEGNVVGVDWHRDSLELVDVANESARPDDYSVGLAAPIRGEGEEILGVLYSVLDWRAIQVDIFDKEQFSLGDDEGVSSSSEAVGYAFLWDAGARRVLAHPDQSLLTESLDTLDGGGLAVLLAGVRQVKDVAVLTYRYKGNEKRSGFLRMRGGDVAPRQEDTSVNLIHPFDRVVLLTDEDSDFGWIVGATVFDEAIFAPLRSVYRILAAAFATGGLSLVLCVYWVSRAITRPLKELTREAERIARGDFAARVKPSGPLETASLANSFNRMAEDLDKSQKALIVAEKDAAWREMARQVSHDIKNPLTPMKLWVQLVERAWNDRSSEFESILRRAVKTLDTQIEVLRRIATNFRALAGNSASQAREPVRLGALLDSACELYAAAAREKGVRIERQGGDATILGDRDEILRVFVNLIDNAMHVAPAGSPIRIELEVDAGMARVAVVDAGPGIDVNARPRLFTPYFSTRTHGTGLGLATVRRIAEAHGGRAYLDGARGGGARLIVEFPAAANTHSQT